MMPARERRFDSRTAEILTRLMLLSPLRLALIVGLIFLVLIALLAFGTVRNVAAISRTRADSELRELTAMIAASIDGDLHAVIVAPGQFDSPEYRSLLRPLIEFRNSLPEIYNLYTVRADGDKFRVVLDTENSPDLMQHGDSPYKPMNEVEFDLQFEPLLLPTLRAGQVYVDTRAYDTDTPQFFLRSVEAPIRDASGAMDGMLVVDFTESKYQGRALGFDVGLTAAVILNALMAGFIGVLVYWLRRRIGEAMLALDQEVITDPLTGMFNRRYFDSQLRESIAIAQRHHRALAMLLLDIDHFKQINDVHGHPAGDQVLRRVASQMLAVLRKEDMCYRIGGEEFAVLMQGAGINDARAVYRRLGGAVRQPIECGDTVLAVTVSGGVAQLQHDSDSPDSLLRRADDALYAAKQAGRDRVEDAE